MKQQEWELEAQDEDDFILGRRYNVFEKFHDLEYQVDHGFVKEMQGEGGSTGTLPVWAIWLWLSSH